MVDKNKYKEIDNIIGDSTRVLYDEPMKKHTTARVGGNVDVLVVPINANEIKSVIKFAKENEIKYYIIGCGSNLLVSDEPLHAIVIKLTNKFGRAYINGDILIADAGAAMPYISILAKKNSLSGLEFASGIPGSIGGGVRMNAGAYGSCIENVFLQATYIDSDGNIEVINKNQMEFGYRHSYFKEHKDFVIISVKLQLQKGDIEEISLKMKGNNEARTSKQPLEYPNFGSVFKRPEGYFVGKLISDAGLKGYTIGGAQVSTKHAGFMVNTGNATCADFIELIHYVQDVIYKKDKVILEPEVELIGGKL